jgi:cytochrome c oxidase subunit 2
LIRFEAEGSRIESPGVPWKRAVTAVCLASLVLPGLAAAGNGGVAPPDPVTSSGEAIRDVYWVALAVVAVVFVLVETALVIFIVRFRRRRAPAGDEEGPQIHGNTRLELAWTLVPAVILAGLAAFTLVKATDVEAEPASSANVLTVRVDAHQFYWLYRYPNGAVSLDTLYLPVNRPVALELNAADVNHSWWVPELTGKKDAIPGRINVLNFEPRSTGTFRGKCAEHCGVQHAVMQTTVEVVSGQEFDGWLAENAPEAVDPVELGRQEWEAVCAKCHLSDGSGLVGPVVAGNGTMLELESLRQLLLSGQNRPDLAGYMPAVGTGWEDFQFEALLGYIQSSEQLSAPPGQQDGGASGS